MYLQITTRCNMSCEHCGFSCGKKGYDMTLETFKKCLEFEDSIAIGGGEPTIHPDFWNFFGSAVERSEHVWMATNGSMENISIALANLSKNNENFTCVLSQDYYHDEIEDRVINSFNNNIKNVENGLINSGRCNFGKEGCICPDTIVRPNGDISFCGCEKSPKIGNVNDGTENYYKYKEKCGFPDYDCYKEYFDTEDTKNEKVA